MLSFRANKVLANISLKGRLRRYVDQRRGAGSLSPQGVRRQTACKGCLGAERAGTLCELENGVKEELSSLALGSRLEGPLSCAVWTGMYGLG